MNALLWVVGLAATAVAIWQFSIYSAHSSENEGFAHMIYAIVAIIIACVCAFVFFYKKTKDAADQDISITKF
jgi:chromate transport protein ChrA